MLNVNSPTHNFLREKKLMFTSYTPDLKQLIATYCLM